MLVIIDSQLYPHRIGGYVYDLSTYHANHMLMSTVH